MEMNEDVFDDGEAYAFADDEQEDSGVKFTKDAWKIMIVDDDSSIHDVTRLALRGLIFDDRTIEFIDAYSGAEAIDLIQVHKDTALILLDVVMEQDDAGLRVVRTIRDELKNTEVRIVLRTGQPGQAPEPEIIMNYDINDYKEKTELTKQKLITSAISGLRGFRDLMRLRHANMENARMKAELNISRRLQQMILPDAKELRDVQELDIACYMKPADEVGGDYYDVFQHEGHVKIGIGDVTGHGLESSVLMLMTQTAVRTLTNAGETDPARFMDVLNRTLYENILRMQMDKNLTFLLFDYHNSQFQFTGQHECVLVVQKGRIECVDTIDLGFMLGIKDDIHHLVHHKNVTLEPGDGLVLYTDGLTEAWGKDRKQYGMDRLCQMILAYWEQPALTIQQKIIEDVSRHLGVDKAIDDITLLVIKQLGVVAKIAQPA